MSYRLILRCRQVARARFAKLRSDVLVKMELLDNKHVQSLGGHLSKLIKGLAELHTNTAELLAGPALFPIEVDLSNSAFQYKSTTPIVPVRVKYFLCSYEGLLLYFRTRHQNKIVKQ